jgi:hypothetical protein
MKVFNRAIKLGGETQTVGTPTINVLETDANSDVMRATGATLPTDGDRGYAVGCLFVQTDGGTETVLYVNEGSATSADFNPVLGGVKKAADLTATNTLTAADSGKVLFLNDDTEFATTLPAPAAGLNFKFIVKAAPAGADYTIVTASGANIIIGGINELETDNTEDGPYDDDADTITFEASVAVKGDWVELVSDGTSWYLTGQTKADGGITLSTT